MEIMKVPTEINNNERTIPRCICHLFLQFAKAEALAKQQNCHNFKVERSIGEGLSDA